MNFYIACKSNFIFFYRKCEECDDLSRRNEELDTELTLSAKEAVDLQERVESLLRYKEFLYDKLISVTYKGYQLAERDRWDTLPVPGLFPITQTYASKFDI